MKAIYQKPTTDILLVMAQTILAGSANLGEGDDPNSIDLDGAGSTDDLPPGWTPGARRGSIWDDED